MKSFIEQAHIYAADHQNTKTHSAYWVSVPLIVFSIMILLSFIKISIPGVFATTLAFIATLCALFYYFRLHWQLAIVLTPIFFIMLGVASWIGADGPSFLGIWSFIICFILGWGMQIYGHFIEGKKPTYVDYVNEALIAPLCLTGELIFRAGYMSSLKEQIYGSEKDEE